jgi:mannose-6-phosphate isomerase-like protein (cupin superfamily)
MMDAPVTDAFAAWSQWRRDELAANGENGHVGTRLVAETARGRVWHLTLQPGERLPFHRHVLDYFWTVTSPGGGRGRSHYGDGRIVEVEYAEGDTRHMFFAAGESMIHDLENTGTAPLSFVTVEYLPGANAPLAL